MSLIHVYKTNPTVSQRDGELVSEGTGDTGISIGPLDAATNEESNAIKLAIRCEIGYGSIGDTTIRPTGTTASNWALALDDGNKPGVWQPFGSRLVMGIPITDYNTVFWAKARANDAETARVDETVDLLVAAIVQTVEEGE